ncbi:MAG: DnaJ domain-containing protein, partial [Chloroflexota bacterium]
MSSQTTDPDPYAVLGVSANTPFTEVRAAHRRLIRELHPDINPTARERFDAVQWAFELLRKHHEHTHARAGNRQTPTQIGHGASMTHPDGADRGERATNGADPKGATAPLDEAEAGTEGGQFDRAGVGRVLDSVGPGHTAA